jgi:copper transport protein
MGDGIVILARMTATTGRDASNTTRRPTGRKGVEPVGALRPGIGGRPGDDPATVGALRPSLAARSGNGPGDPSPKRNGDGDSRGAGDPSGGRPAGGAVAGASPPWLWHAPLVVLGAAAAAGGSAVARGTGGVVVAPAFAAGLRGISYAGLVLAAGGLAFALVAWRDGLRLRRMATLVWSGWLTVVLATVLLLPLRDGTGSATPGGDRIVTALSLRLGLLLVGVVWMSAALTGRAAPRAVGLALGVAMACTWVYAGPADPGLLTVVVTVAHIAAACVWAGGLAVLAAVMLPRGPDRHLTGALPAFSRLATGAVAVLAVSGALHGWSRAGSIGDLFTTGYGQAFWLKVAAVAAMLVVGNANRVYVARHVTDRPAPDEAPPPLHMLGLFLGAELAFGILVVVVTGILVGAPVDA